MEKKEKHIFADNNDGMSQLKVSDDERPNDLCETISLMNSPDYRERFKAEYHQLSIRIEKLRKFINKIRASDYTRGMNVAHDCPLGMLLDQLHIMEEYRNILEQRSVVEGLDL